MDRGRGSWVRRAGHRLVKPVILGHRTLHREATGRTMYACAGAVIRTPVLIVQGEDDTNVPVSQAITGVLDVPI